MRTRANVAIRAMTVGRDRLMTNIKGLTLEFIAIEIDLDSEDA